jgi:hypothetical protein
MIDISTPWGIRDDGVGNLTKKIQQALVGTPCDPRQDRVPGAHARPSTKRVLESFDHRRIDVNSK